WSATRRAGFGLRLVPSGVNVFQSMTVAGNLRASGDLEAALGLFPELEALLTQQAATLSGGQRQLLAVACALSGNWRVLLVDEPVQGIAPELAERVYSALAAAVTPERAVLVADPVVGRALRVADFVWRLERGRVTFAGEPSELASQGV
ncbi:MAG TPA: ATP-binding cassette domain-containing protein, partial [Actinocrinis sp.]|uniref:ATP-binding cassette domain-containing protein n=1 Tax=Actinocrinis sp. TaxID=1920516 RepID=UPI002DDCFB36